MTTPRVNAAALVRKAFPFPNLFVAEKAVSLYTEIFYSTGLPLSPHFNPRRILCHINGLGVFLGSSTMFYALLQYRFQYLPRGVGRTTVRLSWNIHLNHSSQATLYPVHPNTGSFPSRSSLPDQKKFPTVKGLHGSWVRPHAIEDSPSTLTPSISPKLGVRSQHQKLHRYALNGFLAPSSNKDLLTRIPHHLFTYILYSFYSFFASARNKKPV